MENFNITIESRKRNFSVFIISDVHEGNICFHERAFKKAISMIEKSKQTRESKVILMGDLVDCITHNDVKRFSPVEISKKYKLKDLKDLPRKQMQYFAEMIKPLKENILFCMVGNHEESYVKYNGFDIYDYFCTDLMKVEKMGFEAIGNLTFKTISGENNHTSKMLRLALTHGTGGGGFREGYAINHCTDIFKKYRCNIHIMAHLHKLESKTYQSLITSQAGKMIKEYIWYCVNGCFLDSHVPGKKNYFEGRKGHPSDIGLFEIRVDKISNSWNYKVLKHLWKNGRFDLV